MERAKEVVATAEVMAGATKVTEAATAMETATEVVDWAMAAAMDAAAAVAWVGEGQGAGAEAMVAAEGAAGRAVMVVWHSSCHSCNRESGGRRSRSLGAPRSP